MATECNVIGWLDPVFASKVAHLCAAHDEDYRQATKRVKAGLPRGGELTRLASDWRWVKGAFKVDRARAIFYGAFLLAGGWALWYDLDKKLGL